MADTNSSAVHVDSEVIEATREAAGWLLSVAQASMEQGHPDAHAAYRWLDKLGSKMYELQKERGEVRVLQ